MKVLIPILIGLLVVGCGEVENGAYKHRPKQTDTNESTPTTNTNQVDGTTAKPVKELTAEEFVTEVIKSLADGSKQVPFDLSDKVIAMDSGKEIPQERFKKIWPEFAKMAFEEDAPKDVIASKLKIQLSLVEDNSEFLTNIRKAAEQEDINAMRFMRVYKPQAGDMYCDASKPKEAGKSLVKYEKAFIYIIRKTQGKWRLLGIGG
jgi:hypothetical protein